MRETKALLEALTINYPPGKGQRHSIHINKGGDLEVTLFLGEHYQPLIITGDDLDTPTEQALIEIDNVLPDWCKEADLNARVPPGVAQQNKLVDKTP